MLEYDSLLFSGVPEFIVNINKHYLFYKLKEDVCYATIKMISDCNGCSEDFTLHLFNSALLHPTITQVCSLGGAYIELPEADCGGFVAIGGQL